MIETNLIFIFPFASCACHCLDNYSTMHCCVKIQFEIEFSNRAPSMYPTTLRQQSFSEKGDVSHNQVDGYGWIQGR